MPIVELAALDAELRVISERARAVVARVGVERVAEPPGPNRWSVAECLVHLNITSNAYLPVWRAALKDARPGDSTGPFKLDLWGSFFVWFLEPPPKLRFPAPRAFQPVQIPRGDEVLPAFLHCQEQVQHVIADAAGFPIDRIKIRSPFSRRLRYSVWSSLRALLAHQRRHLLQAERAADALVHSTFRLEAQ